MSESQYIKLYRNVIDPRICQALISTYERLWREETQKIREMSLCYDVKGIKICGACDCQRLDIMQHDEFKDLFRFTLGYIQKQIDIYKKDAGIVKEQWPDNFAFENFRIKRYLPDDKQQHDFHSDVTNKTAAKRFISIICYLNDDFEGGETSFPNFKYDSKVTTGGIIIFPCTWSYLHKGNPVKSGNAKYILGTFLNYVDEQETNRKGDQKLGTKGL
jgi:hypothetical protein